VDFARKKGATQLFLTRSAKPRTLVEASETSVREQASAQEELGSTFLAGKVH